MRGSSRCSRRGTADRTETAHCNSAAVQHLYNQTRRRIAGAAVRWIDIPVDRVEYTGLGPAGFTLKTDLHSLAVLDFLHLAHRSAAARRPQALQRFVTADEARGEPSASVAGPSPSPGAGVGALSHVVEDDANRLDNGDDQRPEQELPSVPRVLGVLTPAHFRPPLSDPNRSCPVDRVCLTYVQWLPPSHSTGTEGSMHQAAFHAELAHRFDANGGRRHWSVGSARRRAAAGPLG